MPSLLLSMKASSASFIITPMYLPVGLWYIEEDILFKSSINETFISNDVGQLINQTIEIILTETKKYK